MTAIVLPTTSMPGQRPQESGGRLINCFAESLGETAGTPLKLVRAPGLSRFGTTNETIFRGGFQLGALVYTAWSGKVNTHTAGRRGGYRSCRRAARKRSGVLRAQQQDDARMSSSSRPTTVRSSPRPARCRPIRMRMSARRTPSAS